MTQEPAGTCEVCADSSSEGAARHRRAREAFATQVELSRAVCQALHETGDPAAAPSRAAWDAYEAGTKDRGTWLDISKRSEPAGECPLAQELFAEWDHTSPVIVFYGYYREAKPDEHLGGDFARIRYGVARWADEIQNPPQDGETEPDEDFDDEDEEDDPQPGDTIIDFSTDPPTVWTVPDPDSEPDEPGAEGDATDGRSS